MMMRLIPIFKVRDMRTALKHYTEVLDFIMTDPDDTVDSPVIDLGNGDAAFQITTHESERLFGSVANVWVDDVDALFAKYKSRGLDTTGKEHSPVMEPFDQTWGRREFYVKDADGNTLRFVMPVK
ncbi:MAG: VOC family protein [Bacteroidota bacterium]